MKWLCCLAVLGQGLLLVYRAFAVFAVFTVGLARNADMGIALLLPLISGSSAVMLVRAARHFGEARAA